MSLFSVLSIGESGMAAQRMRAELLTENLANAETTRTPEGGPYRRKDAVFEIVTDNSAPERRFMPGHPDADAEGYVAFPHINPAEDMVDLMGASRNYEANVAAI